MVQPKRKRVYYPGCLRHTHLVPIDEYQAAQQKWLEAEQRGKDCPKCRAEQSRAEVRGVSVVTREEQKARQDSVNARKLALELVPSPLWGVSLKNLLLRSQWDIIRRNAYKEAEYHCRICGAEGRMNAHEQWVYDDETYLQRLTGIIALCDWCHHVKHLGHSNILAREGKLDIEQVIAHYCAVNGCTRDEYEGDSTAAFDRWQKRSAILTWTTDFGEYASLVQPGEVRDLSGWILPGVITSWERTAAMWWLSGLNSCRECGGPFEQPTYYTVRFKAQSNPDADYHDMYVDVCSLDCAQKCASKAPKGAPQKMRVEGKPTDPTLRREGWIYARAHGAGYPEETERSGKWLIFADREHIDALWQTIRAAVMAGKLGDTAKVATTPGTKSREGIPQYPICVYTYDSNDEADVWRIRDALRALGISWRLYYKTDEATLQGRYSGSGQRVSKYSG